MNQALLDRIARAVLYEGYILYPYRPSVKNRQRWTFGGLYPRAYSQAQGGTEAWSQQTECLVTGAARTVLEVKVRFLHLRARTIGALTPPLKTWPTEGEPAFRPVEALPVGDKLWQTWQEAAEREVNLGERELGDLVQLQQTMFAFPAERLLEPLPAPNGEIVGVAVYEQKEIEGTVQLSAQPVGERLFQVTVKVLNRTPWQDSGRADRDAVLLHSLVSTHTVLGVRGGEFISLLDPPAEWVEAAGRCHNVGAWPVLVGETGERDTMLASPIILYDYPQVAPESPGDLFDATEIDEILTLRILTLTDAEKRAMAAVDERARALLERTHALTPDDLLAMHGAIRRPGSLQGGA